MSGVTAKYNSSHLEVVVRPPATSEVHALRHSRRADSSSLLPSRMARSLRLEHPGAIWHLTSRGNERHDIFLADRDRRRFLDIVADVVEMTRWVVSAYALMSNHYHLLLETPLPTLSVGAKRLNERYAQAFNIEHRRVGHLFQGRFKAILVEREAHYLELIRYVVLSPVRAGIVGLPGDYGWSSYRATAGLCDAPPWLAVDDVLDEFGPGSHPERCARYRDFVADGRGAAYAPWEQLTGQIYLGGAAFCDRVQTLIGAKREASVYPDAQRNPVRPTLDGVVAIVAGVFGVGETDLRRRSHQPGRKALARFLSREAGLPFTMIGDWMGVSGQAAAHLARKAIDLEERDAAFATRLGTITRALAAMKEETGDVV